MENQFNVTGNKYERRISALKLNVWKPRAIQVLYFKLLGPILEQRRHIKVK
jgi:hypothetical protein